LDTPSYMGLLLISMSCPLSWENLLKYVTVPYVGGPAIQHTTYAWHLGKNR